MVKNVINLLYDLVFAQDVHRYLDGTIVSSSLVEYGIHRDKCGSSNPEK
jgi:hypothetical protein